MPKKSQSASRPFYITTTLPYVNSAPHIGHAMEFIRADVIARYKKLTGFEVFFNTGTDEHGIKVYRKAAEAGKSPQEFVDNCAEKFKRLLPAIGISPDINFIRTTDSRHVAAAEEFWKRCEKNGDIYKKKYKIKYCVGCELEKTESELVNDRCPLHPGQAIEIIEEENYFFRFSKYQKPLLDLYRKTPDFVIPDSRFGEIRTFVLRGLEDFSISRLASKMPWGVPVPNDPAQVMYVWFDALVSYISAIGWPEKAADFEKWWNESGGVIQYCGKDNLRQQSAMWQAMLMSAGLSPSRQIVINGFITHDGRKMSKSEGNVIDPFSVVKEYGSCGADALRYFVVRELHPFEDSDFTMEKFKNAYNSHLANGLGNLVSRVMKMAEANLPAPVSVPNEDFSGDAVQNKTILGDILPPDFKKALDEFDIQKATNVIWAQIGALDATIQETAPFKLIKTEKKQALKIIKELVAGLYQIATELQPIMPETATKIMALVKANNAPESPIFPRRD
ncbi:MAG: methionine--tRNA ligase [Patescibacteria group bacterium]